MNKLKVNLIGIFILATFMIDPTVIFANSVEIIEPEVIPVSNNMLRGSDSIDIQNEPLELIGNELNEFELNQIYEKYYEVYPEYKDSSESIKFIDSETKKEILYDEQVKTTISPRLAMAKVNAKQNPYYSTANIHTYWFRPNNQVYTAVGSGFYSGGQNVATAAHVVYNKKLGGWATYASVAFGRNGAHDYSWYVETNNFTSLQGYLDNPKVGMYDIAKIRGTVWSNHGVPVRPLIGTSTEKFTASNYGYPGSLAGYSGFEQYVASGTFEFEGTMYKTTNTFAKPGMSGGPLNTNGVVGLLSGGTNTTDYYVPMYASYMDFLRN
ncbi:trypsin-like serine peptidase [Carnobacterium maltaromaticum]|uniref:trypsin-like serine peptidase n=1 Tax=Carnobacterium maltaromaticum TaxID=2751 RepID=UPI003C13ADB0